MTLLDYSTAKNKFSGVAMIRLSYNAGYYDYSIWKISGQNIFFYDENLKVCHVLWTTDPIKVIDDNHIVISQDDKYDIGLEFFYGGAILP